MSATKFATYEDWWEACDAVRASNPSFANWRTDPQIKEQYLAALNQIGAPPWRRRSTGDWSFLQTVVLFCVMGFFTLSTIGAIGDQFAKQHPIRNGIGHIFYKVGDALGLIPYVAPFFFLKEPPEVEHQAVQANGLTESGEINHEFTEN